MHRALPVVVAVCAVLMPALPGCGALRRSPDSPVDAGMNTNNIVDPVAQADQEQLANTRDLFAIAERLKRVPTPEQLARRRSVLCLSGGGSYGAFSAGVLCGWAG